MRGLEGQRVLVTGGTGDIGRATAERFLEHGARVVVADIRRPHADPSDRAPVRAAFVECDVTQRSAVQSAVEFAIAELGGIDTAIACAGIVVNAPLEQISENDWRRTLDVNLSGTMFLFQTAAGAMQQNPPGPGGRRGALLCTGSWMQKLPWPTGASYCASKGGQEMLVKVAAQEFAASGITCNIVAPGVVYAGLARGIYDRDSVYREQVGSTIPWGRLGTAEEVAAAFAFLASSDAEYVTGSTLTVDGGASLVRREG